MRLHHRAVVAAAVVHWIAGALWYAAFTAPFTRYMGGAKLAELQSRSEPLAFGGAFAASILLAYALASLTARVTASLRLAAAAWMLVAATQSQTVLFEGRHAGLYAINVGYQLVAIVLMVFILDRWRAAPTPESQR